MASLKIPVTFGAAPGGRPAAACEITPEGVLAAATPAAGQPAVYAFEALKPGTVLPGLLEANLIDPPAVAAAIRTAMGQVGSRLRAVTVVVPDSCVRVFVLDFDTMPTRQDEALPVLRFRLRKSVPFDVEQAGISYQVLTEGNSREETQWRVLAAIMPGPVLAEYEAAVRAAGYEPGVLLPASLAALCALDSREAVLAVCLGSQALTTAIVSGNDVLLHRTIELPRALDISRALELSHAMELPKAPAHEPVLIEESLAVGTAELVMYDDEQGGLLDYSDQPGPLSDLHQDHALDEQRAEIQRSIAVAAAFYEDKLHARPHRVLYSGVLPARAFAELLDDPALAVGELVARPETGFVSAIGHASVAGVTGVLTGTK